jgi:hypothetical protein
VNANVIKALKCVWDFAANQNNRFVLTPWTFIQGSGYSCRLLGDQTPAYSLYRKETLDDGNILYEGQFHYNFCNVSAKRESVKVTNPEFFFKQVDEVIKASHLTQLSPTEYLDFLRYLNNNLPPDALQNVGSYGMKQTFAARPLVGRTLASLTPSEIRLLPDNLELYCLRNEGGLWWKTLSGDTPVAFHDLQSSSYEGAKRIESYVVEV